MFRFVRGYLKINDLREHIYLVSSLLSHRSDFIFIGIKLKIYRNKIKKIYMSHIGLLLNFYTTKLYSDVLF